MDLLYGGRQFFEVKRYTLTGGKADGVRCVDADLGDLCFTVIADRGMDIGSAKYCGKQAAFISKNGVAAPDYFNPEDKGWLESFGGGLLVTCGLQNAGDPCVYNGTKHGLHGRISNIPAEHIDIQREDRDGDIYVTITGTVREWRLMDCDYELHRVITAKAGGNAIAVKDRIVNRSDIPQPLMLLYHLNFGYPLICPDTVLDVPGVKRVEPFDKNAEKGLARWGKYYPPAPGMPEEVFLLDGKGTFSIKSPEIELQVRYSEDTLPYIGLWKSLRPDEYASALEPCNNHIRGVKWEDENGSLRMLDPGEEEYITIDFEFNR